MGCCIEASGWLAWSYKVIQIHIGSVFIFWIVNGYCWFICDGYYLIVFNTCSIIYRDVDNGFLILGMRPSSSLVTIASSNSSVEYIHRLESEILELKEARVRDQKAQAKQEKAQKNILNFLRSKGYDDILAYGAGSSSS